MADWIEGPFSDRILGYCTNVHAGATVDELLSNLRYFATNVRHRYCPDDELPIGLWMSAEVLDELRETGYSMDLKEVFWNHRLAPFTINGFPFTNFHEPVVKHRVYDPNWIDPKRGDFCSNLPRPLFGMTRLGGELSISTLPIGWHAHIATRDMKTIVENLWDCIFSYKLDSNETKGIVHLDLEPEPGCYLESSKDVVEFFERHIFVDHPGDDYCDNSLQEVQKHLRICHDICHAAVMFEDQAEMFRRYDDAGIKVGKVQVSNAIRVDFDALSEKEKPKALQQLKAFEEDRYLHQTCIRDNATGEITFHEDLPLATKAAEQNGEPIGEWRIHFHVPVYLESFGLLSTTRDYIDDCLELMKPKKDVKHFEVETYAWNVLPPELQREDLAEGIADELIWVRDRMQGIK